MVVILVLDLGHLSREVTSMNEEPPTKKRKWETEDGEKIISEFLDNVRKLSLRDDISNAEMSSEFERMKSAFISCDNDYVQSIINTIS